MALDAISGKNGYVEIGSCDVCSFQSWTATLDKGIQTYNARCGNGWQLTQIGNKKFSGSITGVYDPTDPIESHIDTDSLVTLYLYHDSTQYHYGSARLGRITYGVNSDTGAIETWSVDFESHGQWSNG